MALSDLQKRKNKAANRVRDKRYGEAVREYRSALEGLSGHPLLTAARETAEDARKAFEQRISEMNAAEHEILEQIEVLKRKLDDIRASNAAPMELARAEKNKAWDEYHRQRKLLTEAVNGQHGEISQTHYVSQWEIPATVLAEMQAAADAVSE